MMEKEEKLKKVRIVLLVCFPMCLMSMNVVFKSLESHVVWKIIASSVGFLFFLGMTIMVYLQFIELRKS
jgi:protein-S-isoprenylcysteine O-methyltransferase Ste14